MARKGRTKVIYKGTFVLKQSLPEITDFDFLQQSQNRARF
jgi:hypothetical protein